MLHDVVTHNALTMDECLRTRERASLAIARARSLLDLLDRPDNHVASDVIWLQVGESAFSSSALDGAASWQSAA